VPPSQSRSSKLALPNTFAARDRAFITKLGEELNLAVAWDEYDEEDQNVVTFRLPGASEDAISDEDGSDGDDEEWEDEEDAEANDAVDRVLKKYNKMKLADDEGDPEERYEKKLKESMDVWKRDYYKVSFILSRML